MAAIGALWPFTSRPSNLASDAWLSFESRCNLNRPRPDVPRQPLQIH